MAGLTAPALELIGVTKRFGPVTAVQDVSFAIAPGEVVALAGENGAGKSSLKNLIGGLYRPDEGEVHVNGSPRGGGVAGVRAQGVSTVHQEISLFPHLTVAENLLINHMDRYPALNLRPARLRADAARYLDRVGAGFSPDRLVSSLSTGQRQLVEIAKALVDAPQILVLDEPTSSLNLAERAKVLQLVRELSAEGVAIIYVGHSLDELFSISHRTIVMRDGRLVGDIPTSELTRHELEELMVGRELAAGYPELADPGKDVALAVRELGDGDAIRGVSFEIHAGEIFGLAGLMGSGRTEVARAVFGSAGARELSKSVGARSPTTRATRSPPGSHS